ncbi:MAG: hypothetical protein M3450_05210 [Actinomycetota bacterium]|nr:hypothetical protein [Actinomycetota bacterium]
MASTRPTTGTWEMADRLAGGNLEEQLRELRGKGMSYERVAKGLHSNHGISVSWHTVANWCRQLGLAT